MCSAASVAGTTEHARALPWREDVSAYHVMLSEIILQQTRVDQGMAYYHRFTERFPTVQDLAAASEDEVLLLWQGLGYYSRGRNLLHAAQIIVSDFGGEIPHTPEGLSRLARCRALYARCDPLLRLQPPLSHRGR